MGLQAAGDEVIAPLATLRLDPPVEKGMSTLWLQAHGYGEAGTAPVPWEAMAVLNMTMLRGQHY